MSIPIPLLLLSILANIIPKWLAMWGLITVPFILVGWSLEAFGATVPFALYIPYVPWEWVAGIYILANTVNKRRQIRVCE